MAQFFEKQMKRKAIAALTIAHLAEEEEEENEQHWKRGKTREWVKRRTEKGYFNNIVRELAIDEDTASYKEMMRMSHEDFTKLLNLIEKDISAKERLALTLGFFSNWRNL